MIVVVALALAAADTPLFSRDEPHLKDAIAALEASDPDLAIERAHEAVVDNDDERAIVEYDIGQALLVRAENDAKASPNKGDGKAPPPPPKLDDAIDSLERAASLAHDKRIQSEAHLAVGNAHLVGQKLDDAIAAYRRALVAEPQNERARRNLQRALLLKQAQPPPPPQQGGGDQQDPQKQDQQKQDQQEQDQQNQDQQKQDQQDQQKQGGQKEDGKNDKQSGKDDGNQADASEPKQGQPDQKKDAKDNADKPDGDGESDNPTDSGNTGKSDEKGPGTQQGAAQPSKKKPTSKEEAKRLLRGLRSRERPLTPLEMRGTDKQRPKQGKDW